MYFFFVPSIQSNFKLATEKLQSNKTASMVQSICNRVASFESQAQLFTTKIGRYVQDAYQPNQTFPYYLANQTYHNNCTSGVSINDTTIMAELNPLWGSIFDLDLGRNHDVNPHRILLLFKN
jgi:hypothetical protein